MTKKEVEFDEKKILKWVKRFENAPKSLFNAKVLQALALRQKNRIYLRTLGGKDTNDNPFKSYNPQYARQSKKVSISDVNLTDTGEMLNGMTQNATDTKAEIFFTTDEQAERASYHDQVGAGKNRVIREFFGMSNQDKDDLFKQYTDKTSELLQKEGFL